MRIFVLTRRGDTLSKQVNAASTDGASLLKHLRMLGGQASDERLREHTGLSDIRFAVAARALKANQLISEVGQPNV
jgi:hypothetical protein